MWLEADVNISFLIISQNPELQINSQITLVEKESWVKHADGKQWSLVTQVDNVFLKNHLFIQQAVVNKMLGVGNTTVNKTKVPCLRGDRW